MQQQSGEKPAEVKDSNSLDGSPVNDPFALPMSLPPADEPMLDPFSEPKIKNPSLETSMEDFPLEDLPTLSHSVQTNDADPVLGDPFPDLMKPFGSADSFVRTAITDLVQADL